MGKDNLRQFFPDKYQNGCFKGETGVPTENQQKHQDCSQGGLGTKMYVPSPACCCRVVDANANLDIKREKVVVTHKLHITLPPTLYPVLRDRGSPLVQLCSLKPTRRWFIYGSMVLCVFAQFRHVCLYHLITNCPCMWTKYRPTEPGHGKPCFGRQKDRLAGHLEGLGLANTLSNI